MSTEYLSYAEWKEAYFRLKKLKNDLKNQDKAATATIRYNSIVAALEFIDFIYSMYPIFKEEKRLAAIDQFPPLLEFVQFIKTKAGQNTKLKKNDGQGRKALLDEVKTKWVDVRFLIEQEEGQQRGEGGGGGDGGGDGGGGGGGGGDGGGGDGGGGDGGDTEGEDEPDRPQATGNLPLFNAHDDPNFRMLQATLYKGIFPFFLKNRVSFFLLFLPTCCFKICYYYR